MADAPTICPYGGTCNCPASGDGGRLCPGYALHADIIDRIRDARDSAELAGAVDLAVFDEAETEIGRLRAVLDTILDTAWNAIRH